jgi:hypothetical protein
MVDKNKVPESGVKKLLRLLYLLGVLGLVSCKTLPTGPFPDIVDWLPPESDIICRLVVPGNEALINMIVQKSGQNPEKVAKITKRTVLVAAGIELGSADGARTLENTPIHLAVVGSWPKNLIGSALGRDWKKSLLHSYRYNGPDGLELTVLSGNELILSKGKSDIILDRIKNGDRSEVMRRGIELKEGSDLALWVTDPTPIINSVSFLPASNSNGSPVITMIGLALSRRDDGDYSLIFSLYPTEDRLSGSLALAVRLALSARFGLSPDPEERALLSELLVEIGSGEVRIILPQVSLEVLGGFLDKLDLLPGTEP